MPIDSVRLSVDHIEQNGHSFPCWDKPMQVIHPDSRRESQILDFINAFFKKNAIDVREVQKVEITQEGKLSISYISGATVIFDELSKTELEGVKKIARAAQNILTITPQSEKSPVIEIALIRPPPPPQQHIRVSKDSMLTTFAHIKSAETTFGRAASAAKATIQTIEKAAQDQTLKFLEQTSQLRESMEKINALNPTALDHLKRLESQFDQASLELKHAFDMENAHNYTTLENHLLDMTKQYNRLLRSIGQESKRKEPNELLLNDLRIIRTKMQRDIDACNKALSQTSLTTHPMSIEKSNVLRLAAVIKKKFQLRLEQAICQKSIQALDAQSQDKTLRKKLQKKLEDLNKKISRAPADARLKEISEEIGHKIRGDLPKVTPAWITLSQGLSKLHVFVQSKSAYHRYDSTFKWGNTALSTLLTTPVNWTTIHKAFVKQSRSGAFYVSGTTIEPLNIEATGGVPSSLRAANAFRDRPANLLQTRSYVLSEDGQRRVYDVSFRGAQFASVEAAKEALKRILAVTSSQELHINSLLTPAVVGPDRTLLKKHKEHIYAALNSLIEENASNTTYGARLRRLKDDHSLTVSNFGVNKYAVDPDRLWTTFGWHTAIKQYSQTARRNLNRSLSHALNLNTQANALSDYSLQELDRLAALVQTGQEMEAFWATNAFAGISLSRSPFTFPVLWKTMDALLGTCCFTNCKSGKDRTGKVEAQATSYLEEIAMNTMEHKASLDRLVTDLSRTLGMPQKQQEWEALRPFLTAACFTADDIKALCTAFRTTDAPLKTLILIKIEEKYHNARQALGIAVVGERFMRPKSVSRFFWWKTGTSGISKSRPKRSIPSRQRAAAKFPKLSTSTLFIEPINWSHTKELRKRLQENPLGYEELVNAYRRRHVEAVNARLNQCAGLDITQKNTSISGFKTTDPFHSSSGFDRDYILLKIFQHLETPIEESGATLRLEEWLGLNEFDPVTRQEWNLRIGEAHTFSDYQKLLKTLEKAKTLMLSPQVKVAS